MRSWLAPAMLVACTAIQCTLLAPTDAELRGSAPATTVTEAGADADRDGAVGHDGSADGAQGEPVYNDVASAAFWSAFDLTSQYPIAKDFIGGAFDGRYVYFPSARAAFVARYDTQQPFDASTAWSTFDTKPLSAKINGFGGALFDGRFLYVIPFGDVTPNGVVVRFDTQADFGANASWTSFDMTTIVAQAQGYLGGAFDGRYLYFAPHRNEFSGSHGHVMRFDTQGDLGVPASWTSYDARAISPQVEGGGYCGAVFDGRGITFVQNQDSNQPWGQMAHFDTQADFKSASSWEFFDLPDVSTSAARGYFGGAFDGRYVYAVPSKPNGPNILARYDSTASFSTAWLTFDTTKVDPRLVGFRGGAFDGRYVYLVPHEGGVGASVVGRVDSTGALDVTTSWSTFETTSLHPGARHFAGAVFDGRYLYLVPNDGAVFVRFDARTPPTLPSNVPGAHGAFL